MSDLLAPDSEDPLLSLPSSQPPFVGREEEVRQIVALLAQPSLRFLTLLGAGGIGKTRLALEVARRIGVARLLPQAHASDRAATQPTNRRFGDGVFFVPLASLERTTDLASAIANGVGLSSHLSDPKQALIQSLRHKELLLVLDNFEHLLEGAPLVAELLQASPNLCILVTSRNRLNLYGEQLFYVAGMTYSLNDSLERAIDSSAVRLFVQSARQVQPTFTLNKRNLAAVLRLCQWVDGMPLALELAAAWSRVLPVEEIIREIEKSADFLGDDGSNRNDRQRSMKAVFEWSWKLLNDNERTVLCQVSIFRGGFMRQAAEQVAGASLRLLADLVYKSLLRVTLHQEGFAIQGDVQEHSQTHTQAHTQEHKGESSAGRYEFHELLRQYAANHLAGDPYVQAQVETRHCHYYLTFVAQRQQRLALAEPQQAAAEVRSEIDNVRLAWVNAAKYECLEEIDQTIHSLWLFYQLEGLLAEQERMFASAVEALQASLSQPLPEKSISAHESSAHESNTNRSRGQKQRLLGKLLAYYARVLQSRARYDAALSFAYQAIEVSQTSQEMVGEAMGHAVCGQALSRKEQHTKAQDHLEQSLRLVQAHLKSSPNSEPLHDIERVAYSWLATNALSMNEPHLARAYLVEGESACRNPGNVRGEMIYLYNSANVDFHLGNYALARRNFEQTLHRARQLRYPWGEGLSLLNLGMIARLQGDYMHAIDWLQQSQRVVNQIGDTLPEVQALANLSMTFTYLGEFASAQEWLDRCLQQTSLIQSPVAERVGLIAQALLALHQEQPIQALAAATRADQLAQQARTHFDQVRACLLVAYAQADLKQEEEAAATYRRAIALCSEMHRPEWLAEAQAGLATLRLAQNNLPEAQALIAPLLPALFELPRCGLEEPFRTYLACYQVMQRMGDKQAEEIGRRANDQLRDYADPIQDEGLRTSFFENVPTHRQLRLANKTSATDNNARSQPHPVIRSPLHDWGEMPAVERFEGRNSELSELERWLLHDRCRLVAVLGMGGAGKTSITAKLAQHVANHFEVVIWRSLLNAPPVDEILRGWLQVFARQNATKSAPALSTSQPTSFDEQVRLLLDTVRQQRALLVLDNIESILQPGVVGSETREVRPGYEGYAHLIERLGASEHRSCLVLTSREQPQLLARLIGQSSAVRLLNLPGLDLQAGRALLQNHGLTASPAEADGLIQHYSGNPLALQIVANTIADLFGGDIATFQQEDTLIFDTIRAVLDQQFARLSELEREVLLWLAIEREAVTVQTVRANLVQPVASRDLLETLRSLQRRSLLEKSGEGVLLQNVVIEYLTDHLVEHLCAELLEHKIEDDSLLTQSLTQSLTLSYLNRFALLKAQSKEYVRQSQVRLIVQPLTERLIARIGKPAVVAKFTALIRLLRHQAPQTPGYAAGNLLNLLIYLRVDLAGYDFSRLCVWQANLRGISAANINFTAADLSRSLFAESFGFIYTIVITPDSSLLAAATSDGEIRVWRLADGTLLRVLRGHRGMVRSIALAPDGTTLVSGGDDATVRIWNLQQEQSIAVLSGHQSHVLAVAISPDGSTIASAGADQYIRLWSLSNASLQAVLTGHTGWVRGVAFSPDGQYMASASYDQTVRLWDAQTTKELKVLYGHTGIVSAVDFHPNSTLLASASTDGSIRLWNLRTETVQVCHSQTGGFWSLGFSPNGAFLAGGCSEKLYLWKLNAIHDEAQELPSLIHVMVGHTNAVQGLAFTADSRVVASGSGDQSLRLWDTQSGQIRQILQGHSQAVMTVVFRSDGMTLVSGHTDRLIRLWDITSRESQLQQTLSGLKRNNGALAISPDNSLLASCGAEGCINLWDVQDRQQFVPSARILVEGGTGSTLLAFSPDSQCLASASSENIHIWNPHHDVLLQSWSIESAIYALAFSPSGRVLATGHSDNLIRLWDWQSGVLLNTLSGHESVVWSVAFSADGAYLASGSFDNSVRLWQLTPSAPSPLHTILSGHRGRVFSVAFSPDSSTLVSGSSDQTLRVWDVASQQLLHTCTGHQNWIWSVAVSPDGRTIASGSIDETIRLWDCHTGICRQTLRALGPYAGMNITGVSGISEAQKAALKALGAVEG